MPVEPLSLIATTMEAAMAEFYMVRHGQASFGSADYDRLSRLGEQQAFWLGQYFLERDIHFDRVIIGTQLRHRQSADNICRGSGQRIAFDAHPGLDEYDFDALFAAVGAEHAQLKQTDTSDKRAFYRSLKQVLQLWMEDKLTAAAPESWTAFGERVAAARSFIRCSGARRVLVISSGGPIGMMARQVLAAPASIAIELNLQVKNTSFSHYYFNQQSVQLASFNNIPHLDVPGRLDSISYG
jgi:broad specificity phosphatase PhoE